MPSLLILIAWLVNLSQAQAKCDVVSFVNTRGVAATPTLPINGGGTELPASSFSLRFIGIGRGTQNYTCATPTSAPVSIGAVATLFDVTELAITDTGLFDLLPNVIVYMPLHQSIFVLGWELSLSVLGHHFFTANITPTFEFTDSNDVFYGKKTADIKADALASKGPAGTGAVDWLQLQDIGSSINVREVYRVITAGGAPPLVCLSTEPITVQYAAQYWFYV